MSLIENKSDIEVMDLLRGNTIWNKARQIVSSSAAHLEQAYAQRKPIGPIEARKIEFSAVEKIAQLVGFEHVLSNDAAEQADKPVFTFKYKNWRNEVSVRNVHPIRVEFGSNEWHPEPQFLLIAFDIDANAERFFAMKDINWKD